jgi:hypothetical protein
MLRPSVADPIAAQQLEDLLRLGGIHGERGVPGHPGAHEGGDERIGQWFVDGTDAHVPIVSRWWLCRVRANTVCDRPVGGASDLYR